MILYYITDRKQFSGTEQDQRRLLLETIEEAAHCGIDLIQLREKDLPARELEHLAREAMARVQRHVGRTQLLVNSRVDIALTSGSHGVHLRSDDLSPAQARAIWAAAACARGRPAPVIAISCHTPEEVWTAAAGADYAVFAPVFEKPGRAATGVEPLRCACLPPKSLQDHAQGAQASHIPVIALGGVTLENARECRDAGAAGIAGIRLFQNHSIAATVEKLRH